VHGAGDAGRIAITYMASSDFTGVSDSAPVASRRMPNGTSFSGAGGS